MNPIRVFYHANCLDGQGAALACKLNFDSTPYKDKVTYHPVHYGDDWRPIVRSGDVVHIVDFSFLRAEIEQMRKMASWITVIDHHKTAEAELAKPFEFENGKCFVKTIFDMNQSGAVLAWKYFHGAHRPVPELLEYIQDRDLWNWVLRGTRPLLRALPVFYPNWQDWAVLIESPNRLDILTEQGTAIDAFIDQEIKKIIRTPPVPWFDGDKVPLYNLPGFMISETLHAALDMYPEAPYAVGFFDLTDKRIYSLRARKGDFDVSDLAKRMGGGGHASAAGFSVPFKSPFGYYSLKEISPAPPGA